MPTLKTDQFTPTDAQNAATSKQMHDFLDSTKTTCIAVVSAFLIIILFIVGPFKPSAGGAGPGSLILMALRVTAACILIYGIITNCRAIGNIYNIKGLFTLNAMSDIRRNFFFSIFFTTLVAVLAVLLIYKHFA